MAGLRLKKRAGVGARFPIEKRVSSDIRAGYEKIFSQEGKSIQNPLHIEVLCQTAYMVLPYQTLQERKMIISPDGLIGTFTRLFDVFMIPGLRAGFP
jgi:hypothetical protein